jgi:hypothetical protein
MFLCSTEPRMLEEYEPLEEFFGEKLLRLFDRDL